jgi:hypothetical protein
MRYIRSLTQKSLTVGVLAILDACISATVQALKANITIRAGRTGKPIRPDLLRNLDASLARVRETSNAFVGACQACMNVLRGLDNRIGKHTMPVKVAL